MEKLSGLIFKKKLSNVSVVDTVESSGSGMRYLRTRMRITLQADVWAVAITGRMVRASFRQAVADLYVITA